MILKSPLVLDTSHWEIIVDFSAISPRPALIITKATESLQGIDGKFIEYFAGMKAAGIPRGCYHFFRKNFDATTQARHFVNFIKPHLNNSDILALDIEEGGETASQIIAFCDFVQAQCPQNLFMVYSTKLLLNAVLMTYAQKERLRNIPTWIAGYPDDPDMFDNVPVMYVPDQSKWGAVWLWQYSDRGIVSGVQGEVDLNWIAPALLEKLPSNIPSEPLPTGAKMYQMTTISSGTRIRTDHNVYAGVVTSVPANTVVSGSEIWTAPEDGNNVKAGDIWMHLPTGWMAFKHMGLPICKDLVYPSTEPTPEPTPAPQYQDVAVAVNVYDGVIAVLVNGEEWVRKA